MTAKHEAIPIDQPRSPSHWCYDPLTGQRVRIAPGRSERPTDLNSVADESALKRCPFCRGNEADTPTELDRLNDEQGDWLTRVVPNRYPAFVLPDGSHEVIIESPEHISRFAELSIEQAALVVQMWARRVRYWRSQPNMEYLLLFKNEGLAAGASLEHLHSQFTVLNAVPDEITSMWQKLALNPRQALSEDSLTIFASNDFMAFSPRAPRAAFETWIASTNASHPFIELAESNEEARELATLIQLLLKETTTIARAGGANLVLQIAPNSMASDVPRWWLELAPRSSAMAGFELATNWRINAVSPEQAVHHLQSRTSHLL